MTDHTDRQHNPFAGEKKPSMLRRSSGNDYHARRMYMITITTANRIPWFGRVVGSTSAPSASKDYPHIELTPLGYAVAHCWYDIHSFHPQIEVILLQMMPDHLHGILFVTEEMSLHLGRAINSFKAGCNKAFRQIILHEDRPAFNKDLNPDNQGRSQLLWSKGYNDRILYQQGQLDRWKNYLHTNPYRLLIKREHPEMFKVQRSLVYGNTSFSAIGNRFLITYPDKKALKCSRSMTPGGIENLRQACLRDAACGTVFISPAISPGEKTIMRALVNGGFPVVFLQENGLTELAKPGGKRFELCAAGRLLILSPWEHHNERQTIKRSQCLELNELAQTLAAL